MGKTKQTSQSEQSSTQSFTPQETEYEKQINPLDVELRKSAQSGLMQTQDLGLKLVSQLLAGGTLPGYLNTLPGGISPDVTQSIVDQSLKDLNTQLAYSGAGSFLESGPSQAMGVRAASDVRNQAEQFNINNLMQLLSLGLGGQAQVQQPIQGFAGQLSQRLAGLRPSTGTATSTGRTVNTRNPFLESFYSSLGGSLGKSAASAPYAFIPGGM